LPSTVEVIVVSGAVCEDKVEIPDTVPSALLVTYMLPLAESKAMNCGRLPIVMGLPITVLVLPEITDTEPGLLPELTTYRLPLAESKAIPSGPEPTGIGLP
jgi:hypothetical protein